MPTSAPDPTRNPHPLLPDGSFQGRRLPGALADGYVQVDGKSDADWVEFVRRLAAGINYVDPQNQVSGNWSPFYEKQPAVAAARLLAWPLEQLGRRLAEHRELIEDRQGSIPVEQLMDSLFDLLTSAVLALDQLTDRLAPATSLRERAEALIAHQLAPAFGRWLAYYRAGAPVYFAALGADEVPAYLRDAYAAGGTLVATQDLIDGHLTLNPRWTGGLSWTDYLADIGTDPIVYGGAPAAALAGEQILHAVGHAFFHGIYELFVSSALHLRAAALTEWQRLQTYPGHAPHLALLLAYLRMRQRQRTLLNGLTDRHLNFYYQRVLRTLPAPARPPRAFLYLEARKNLPPAYLPAGTAFRGGKDPEVGTERNFLSQEAVTVTEATVVEKRAVFKVADNPAVYDFPNENRQVFSPADAGRYFSARVADSADGAGEADLPEDQSGWFPFGQQAPAGGYLRAGMTGARLGLAIASHYLYLREGRRSITIAFADLDPLPPYPGVELSVFFTTAEGWHEVTAYLQEDGLYVVLQPEDPAVVSYDEEIHQQGLTTTLPVARLELPQQEDSLAGNLAMRDRSFSNVYIGVNVQGIRQFALSGSAGVIDPSRPFHPFGPTPRKGDVLIIGNREVSQKLHAEVTYRWSWADPAGAGNVRYEQATLEGSGFGAAERTNLELNAGVLTDYIREDDVAPPGFGPDTPYQAGMTRGYIRLKLLGDWAHAAYPATVADWSAKKAAGIDDTVGVLETINQSVASFMQTTAAAQSVFSNATLEAINSFTELSHAALTEAITTSHGALETAMTEGLSLLSGTIALFPLTSEITDALDSVNASIPGQLGTLSTQVQDALDGLTAAAPGAFEALATALPDAVDSFAESLTVALEPLNAAVSSTTQSIVAASAEGPPTAPFNPLFAELSMDYVLDAHDGNVRTAQQGEHQVFHLTPFGSDPLPETGTRAFLPTVLPQPGTAEGADAGALYLGITPWEPGAQVSLLIQIAEGTADPLLEKPEGHVSWHYLDANQWVAFPNDKLSDGTEGLLRSGLVRLDLPAGTRAVNTRFNDDRQWVRLSVAEKVNAVNRLLGVHANGVEVVQTFTAGQSATNAPLPAATITRLSVPLPGIKKVEQPYATFGGAAPEDRDAYFTRLSERLRHKNRGITEWDIERLVLGAFPAVERVICLQHLEFAPGAVAGQYHYHELRAGHCTVLPLGRSGEAGLRPYVSLSTREAIAEFLGTRMTCHATLHVRNPLFEEVRVRADVKYVTGTDESWAQTQIDADLIDFISPWHDEGLAGLDFSAEVHRSAVVNFLEELAYVDYVKNLVLLHLTDPAQNGAERLRPTRLVSVLASAPHHLITPLAGSETAGLTEVCAPPRRGPRRARVTVTDNPID